MCLAITAQVLCSFLKPPLHVLSAQFATANKIAFGSIHLNFQETAFPGLFIIQPRVHKDHRGFFVETFRNDIFAQHGLPEFVQDNHARSEQQGVVRGLHFQMPPAAQGKLVWVTRGAVLDVVVDIRIGSPTFGQHFSIELSADNFTRLYVPRGFAHGYMTLQAGTEFQYKVDALYSPEHDKGILWNDPALGIAWPDIPPILSEKDTGLPKLADLESPFRFVQP